jgi:hypothetical protein
MYRVSANEKSLCPRRNWKLKYRGGKTIPLKERQVVIVKGRLNKTLYLLSILYFEWSAQKTLCTVVLVGSDCGVVWPRLEIRSELLNWNVCAVKFVGNCDWISVTQFRTETCALLCRYQRYDTVQRKPHTLNKEVCYCLVYAVNQ